MAAQHKRPGRKARMERIERARAREYRKRVMVLFPEGRERYDGFPGKVVAVGIPPRMEEIA